MSVFTRVTPDELGAWLKTYAIGTLVSLEGIAAGIENTNYFVETTLGRYVLTLFEKLAPAELPFYLNLQDHLADKGVPSPKPVPNRKGGFLGNLNGKPAALVRFLPGRDVAVPEEGQCARAGEMLARIHVAGESYPATMDNPRGPKWWTAVMPEIVPFLAAADVAMLKDELQFQSRHRFGRLPRGAIHADYFRDNVLFENGRISGVIDFYFACTDTLLYDVAIAINDWCVADGGTVDIRRATSFIEAYREVRPFTAAERDVWPVMLRAGALRFWVSRLYDFYLPRPGELTHAKDPGHFRRILAAHIARGTGVPELAASAV